MAPVASKAKPLLSTVPWRRIGLRALSGGRIARAPSSSIAQSRPADAEAIVAGKKFLETFTEEFEIGSRKITLETGKVARFANGSVVLAMEETKVLSTVASAKSDGSRDFLPLTVDYQEKRCAQSMIPNTFMRREGAPKERELLCGRLIDRPIRPLFPAGFYHEVQILSSVLSSDGKQDPDVMAANAASAALMLSDIPWGGPIGVIRIGRISGQFIVNPSMDELSLSDLNLVYACTRDKTLMIDVQAREISERDLEAALRLAHPEAVKYLEPQTRLAARAGKQKKEYELYMVSEITYEKIRSLAEAPIEAVFSDPSYGKFERGEALDNIAQDVKKTLEEECDEEGLKVLSKTEDNVRKKVVRRRIIREGIRVDGRRIDEVRPLYCEAGHLPVLHGSSIFSRGETQVLCTVTLGAPGEAQVLDALVGPSSKRFMLHYSFPPFCTNEVGKRLGLNRREVGHGTLAEKSLLAILPQEENCPYTVRISSEVMASDGSTSMASVCAGSMALMDAGIPLKEHVAGLSVGLVSETDPSTGEITDYRILTDILGLEDHLGDMDFKIAGTRDGITAIQLDIKPAGIPLDIICESLEHARKGRFQILDHMEQEINVPRTQDGRNSPRILNLKYSNDAIRRLIGPLGALKRKIEEETGGKISVNDGSLTIVARNQLIMDKVMEKIDFIVGREIEKGGVYKGVVTSIKEYGAFVEINGGQQGLLHISELSHEPVSRVSDVISVGQVLNLMCIGLDVRGNINLSLKATLSKPKTKTTPEGESTVSVQHTPKAQKPANIVQDKQENKASRSVGTMESLSSIVVRSVAECDEQEKSSKTTPDGKSTVSMQHTPKVKKPVNNVLDNKESKAARSLGSVESLSSIVIESASECDEEEKSSKTTQGGKSTVSVQHKPKVKKPVNNVKAAQSLGSMESLSSIVIRSAAECDEEEKSSSLNLLSKAETPLDAKKLKIGMELTAKVHQIRARGLVLDLGNGIHGMYRFETGASTDFEVGDELRVKCSSFSSKGIPVMSLVQ